MSGWLASWALSDLGAHAEAIDEARLALPLLLSEGDDFRLLEPLALNAALQGRTSDAARILGYADRHREANGSVRTPEQQRRRDRTDHLIVDALGELHMDLRTSGAQATHKSAYAWAFGQ